MRRIVDQLKALADPTRLQVFSLVSKGELCVCEIAEQLHVTQSSVSQHLSRLRLAGLVEESREGKWVFYAVRKEAYDELLKELASIVPSVPGEAFRPQRRIDGCPSAVRPVRRRRMMRILFLCTANSCRSQIAEGWAKALRSADIEAYSAGTRPSTVNPLAAKVMAEVGANLSSHRSKSVDEFRDQKFDYAVTLCGSAKEECPVLLGAGKLVHVGFPDPAVAVGTEEEVLAEFRRVRDMIRVFVERLPDSLNPEEGDNHE